MAQRRKRFTISDPAQVRALVSPSRHHILRALSSVGPATVRSLAEHLGRSAESLYYHLRALEKVGLIVDKTPASSSAGEAVYDTPARMIVTDPKVSKPAYLAAYRKSASALLRLVDRQLMSALTRQEERRSARARSLRIQQLQVRLAPADARVLARKLDDIMEFLTEREVADGKEVIAVTLVSCPLEEQAGD